MKKILFIVILILGGMFLYKSKVYAPILNNYISKEDKEYTFEGNIYIGNEEYLNNLKNVGENDILILDQRYLKNPNVRIYDSYKIDDFYIIDYVLNYLLEYEKNNPSNWDRTIKSMRNEWYLHNLAYKFNYDKKRTKHLDLDNNDEEKYRLI